MSKKQYFAILDTETTMQDTVADLAIVICDREGRIHNQCAVLVKDHFDKIDLFHDPKKSDIWGYTGLEKRKQAYDDMLSKGDRMLASIPAINKWINQAIGKYNPTLTAFNLAFDEDKARKTGIDLTGFNDRFCLWQAAIGNICNTKKYKQFVLENAGFNPATGKRNQTFQTNAEMVGSFIKGSFEKENHTALSDVIDFELPILVEVLKKRKWREKITPYVWRNHLVKDHYSAK